MKRHKKRHMTTSSDETKTMRVAKRSAREVVDELLRSGAHTPLELARMSE